MSALLPETCEPQHLPFEPADRTRPVPAVPHLWDREEGETDAAYRGFTTYRDLGPTRTLRGATDALKAKNSGTAPTGAQTEVAGQESGRRGRPRTKAERSASGQVAAWAKKHRWRTRAAAYDAHLEAARLRGRCGSLRTPRRSPPASGR